MTTSQPFPGAEHTNITMIQVVITETCIALATMASTDGGGEYESV